MDGGVGPQKGPGPIGRRGFPGLRCLSCGEETVHVYLDEVHIFHCDNDDCNVSWTADEVEAAMVAWAAVLNWVSLAPRLK